MLINGNRLIAGRILRRRPFRCVLIVNSGIRTVQHYSAKENSTNWPSCKAPTARVVRDRKLTQVATTAVVLGDMVELCTGDRVAADGYLRSSSGLGIDESNLMGESDSAPKSVGDDVLSGNDRRRRFGALATTLSTTGADGGEDIHLANW